MKHVWIFSAGAAVAGAIAGLATGGSLHKAAVKATACAMRVGDAVSAEARTIADEAADARAAERLEARIDAAVQERLTAEEERIRAEVIASLDDQAE